MRSFLKACCPVFRRFFGAFAARIPAKAGTTCLLLVLVAGSNGHAQINEAASWPLVSQAQVDSQGIFLKNLIPSTFTQPLPNIRLADAPTWGHVTFLTRAQITDLIAKTVPDLVPVWSGPERVRVIRRNRMLDEIEIKQMLTSVLQSEHVRERGELELRFVRPFAPIQTPDEALQLKVIDLPNSGVSPQFIARCELRAGDELISNFQINVNAKIWRDIWVARSQLLRGQPMTSADIGLERRDVLAFKDGLVTLPTDLTSYDIGENVPAGAIMTLRAFKQRPIIRRGKMIDAMIQDGSLQIAVKVEALEDGLPGQIVRVRNIKSRREFRGKVQDEETVAVAL